MLEVEIKGKVNNFDLVKEALDKIGAQFVKSEKQEDRIFGHPNFLDKENKIIEGGLIARIRQVDSNAKLEFKEIVRQGGGFEIETILDNVNSGIKLLKKLDFNESFTVSKIREVYKYNDFEIALDQVKQLGSFIEIEKMVSLKEKIEITGQECIDLLKQLSPDAQITNEKYGDMIQDIINQN